MQLALDNVVFPYLLEFWEHLQIKLNKSSLILKNNPDFNFEFVSFGGALVVPGAVIGNHCDNVFYTSLNG